MPHRTKLMALVTLLGVAAGCDSGRHTTAGFHLPQGNVEQGKVAFVALGCNSCHAVTGVDLPKPAAQPPVPVVLGGEVPEKLSDAYLVTSMIDPSYQLAPSYPKNQITAGGQSRMPHYADKMTVRQLIDVTAFLQSNYAIQRAIRNYAYR
jgi:mono/diheme cytochrome c family protein